MNSEPALTASKPTREEIESRLLSFLESRLKTSVVADQDLFARGLVVSMFAMELVVYLEQSFDVVIVGANLHLDNFRSVKAMAELVLRLQQADDD